MLGLLDTTVYQANFFITELHQIERNKLSNKVLMIVVSSCNLYYASY